MKIETQQYISNLNVHECLKITSLLFNFLSNSNCKGRIVKLCILVIFSPLIASADSCSFLFLSSIMYVSSPFFHITSLRVCVLDEFSEYLLETRVNTSADFNTYPIRIFLIHQSVTKMYIVLAYVQARR